MEIGELAAYVCHHLRKHGVVCVLTGGACVSIYTKNKYQSFDLDFIDNSFTNRKIVAEVLKKIDFEENGRYFTHNETKFFLEFPPGPLAIGKEPVKNIHSIVFSTGKLELLTPTDCVKDRLAAFYYWEDLQSLDQALNVSFEKEIDLKEIEKWSNKEGYLDKFKIFHIGLLEMKPKKSK